MSNETKRPYAEVHPIAHGLLAELSPYCERIEIAGSLRRERRFIGDVEMVAIPKIDHAFIDLFGQPSGSYSLVDQWLAKKRIEPTKNGEKYKSFVWQGVKIDLFLVTPETWGCQFLIRTGSADFSHDIVTVCQRWNFNFYDGRLYGPYFGDALDTPEEKDVFKQLGIEYIPPQEREKGMYTIKRIK